jgi:hypothetical protein
MSASLLKADIAQGSRDVRKPAQKATYLPGTLLNEARYRHT